MGLTPTHLTGRDREIRRFLSTLASAPDIPASVRITGLRGVGKTVLLRKLEEVASEQDWATVQLELQPQQNSNSGLIGTLTHTLDRLRRDLSIATRVRRGIASAANTVRRVTTVEWEGVSWSLAGDLAGDASELGEELQKTVDAALKAGKTGFALLLDEAQVLSDDKSRSGDHPLSVLISAVSTLQRAGSPLALVLCGLPTLTVNLLAARTYTERMFTGEEVSSLDRPSAEDAFVLPLHDTGYSATPQLVNAVLDEVEGYPYFIQLWGKELWEIARVSGTSELSEPLLAEAREEIYRRLDLDFYEPRIASLTPAEQDLLVDSGKCPYPPLMVSDLNSRSPKSSGNVNVLLGRLVGENVIYRERKGQYIYTAPGFYEYLERRRRR
ncbi:ATP-binding protein [Mycobacteroides abscessus]|uniref:ATP-binding protein n=1 Tax=Mycobacteroides abscessus TaxID=36809 RepID=UPI0012FFEAF8|nr:ATP-binding protein [Mycobacteroides abscessus]